jgi:fumarate hydratase, class II
VDYVFRDVPVGIGEVGTRRERDSLGSVNIAANVYWGAETQRALKNSPLAGTRMPERFFCCYGHIKKAAAVMNAEAGRLPLWKTAAISRAGDDLIAGSLADQFPLPVWQSGSGRDTDMNVNEVIANRAIQLLGGAPGSRNPVDPTRDVNMSQSLGCTFTAAMYVAMVTEIEEGLVPPCSTLARVIERNSVLPATHGRRLRIALGRLDEAEGCLHELGGEFASSGTEPKMTPDDWRVVVALIARDTDRPFIVGPDGFSDAVSLDAVFAVMAAMRGLAAVLLDVALLLHATADTGGPAAPHAQIEAIASACGHVATQDQPLANACRGGTMFVNRPVIVTQVLESLRRLAEGCDAMHRIAARIR